MQIADVELVKAGWNRLRNRAASWLGISKGMMQSCRCAARWGFEQQHVGGLFVVKEWAKVLWLIISWWRSWGRAIVVKYCFVVWHGSRRLRVRWWVARILLRRRFEQ